jgi:hypothetical protein
VLTTIAFMLGTLLMAFLLDPIHTLPQRLPLGIYFSFQLLALGSARVPSETPCASNACNLSLLAR